MQDGVLATDDGRYFLYTGWYIDRLGDRLAPGSLADQIIGRVDFSGAAR